VASPSVRQFCTAPGKCRRACLGMSFPLKIAPSHDLDPCNNGFLSPQPKWHLDRFSRFCTAHRRASLYFTRAVLSHLKIASYGDLHLIQSMISRTNPSPKPKRYLDQFSQPCRAYDCDRSLYSICNNRPHLRT